MITSPERSEPPGIESSDDGGATHFLSVVPPKVPTKANETAAGAANRGKVAPSASAVWTVAWSC
jgi:hypothetical protein